MSGRTWRPDPKLTREKHNWILVGARQQSWGATVEFACGNGGCTTRMSMPVNVEKDDWSLCFDKENAIQLTDRDGDPLTKD